MAKEQHRSSILGKCSEAARRRLALAVLFAFGFAGTQSAYATKYSVLYAFKGKDGANPQLSSLLRDKAGNLYGTTPSGGDLNACNGSGCGVVFKLDKTGKQIVLHTFTGGNDGADPYGTLVGDGAGNLYGTTIGGGNLSNCNGVGCGVVFMLDAAGAFSVLHNFTGGTDGAVPWGRLIRDKTGTLYGTTQDGGNLDLCNGQGCGVVFMLDPAGKETVLHTFGGADGAGPLGSLVRDASGNLYGTTVGGGDTNFCNGLGCGVVFKLATTGKFTVLHTFEGGSDGAAPAGGLVRDSSGNLYGTTSGAFENGYGTVFKVHGHTETILYSFKGKGFGDGRQPFAGLARDKVGNLYGTTEWGGKECGSLGCGTVFEVAPNGTETVLRRFDLSQGNGQNGGFPFGGVILDSKGHLYGTTFVGETQSATAVWSSSSPPKRTKIGGWPGP